MTYARRVGGFQEAAKRPAKSVSSTCTAAAGTEKGSIPGTASALADALVADPEPDDFVAEPVAVAVPVATAVPDAELVD